MRVITGKAKGRKLLGPKSNKVRPALDKIKGAIFNILFDVEGLHVLDIFAGTGSIGIEAISRGAAQVTFIDNHEPAVAVIKKNLELCGFTKQAMVMKASAKTALSKLSKKKLKFDLIFVDPPYLKDLVNPTLNLLAESSILKPDSIIIVEHHPKEPIDEALPLIVTDTRHYGQTDISFLKLKNPDSY